MELRPFSVRTSAVRRRGLSQRLHQVIHGLHQEFGIGENDGVHAVESKRLGGNVRGRWLATAGAKQLCQILVPEQAAVKGHVFSGGKTKCPESGHGGFAGGYLFSDGFPSNEAMLRRANLDQ